MKNEKNTLNLNIDTDKLVTFKDYQKDYQKLDNISHKFIELIKPKIVNFVKKQLTETLGLALSKSINSTIANSTPNHGKQLQPVCLKDYDQDNKIDRTIRINKNSQIMPSMAWQCGRMAQDYANKQGITLTELIKNINHIQRDQPDDITISVNNPAFKKPLNIVVQWSIVLSNDGASNSPICYNNTKISYEFSHQLIKYIAENAGYLYSEYEDFTYRNITYRDENEVYLKLPDNENNQ